MATSTHESTRIDEAAAAEVAKHIEAVRAAGLTDAANLFETVYSGWLRTISAYVHAHPYVKQPDPGYTPFSALSVADYTIRHWSRLIPGTPQLDDEAVLRAAAMDEAWHRAEDRRMRIAAGEEGL